jgi:murein DD-endopeptidase MepM/ murein hydrolase activator NlpD
MLFQVDNLQSLLDRLYYQERVAEQDRKLIEELRARQAQLAKHKEALSEKKNALGEMVSQIAQKAMAIAKEKLSQQQVADQLRGQRAFYEQAERQLANESAALETQIFRMENSNRKRGGPIAVGSGNMCMPLRAPVTSPFGWRSHPIFRVRKFHTGVDLAGPNRSPIRAADGGNVLFTGWYGGYGKVVIVSHGNNMATLYAHLSRIAVSVGDNVTKGDVIAYEGTTGYSTGPHLHFEVRVNGKPQNPLSYVR